MKLNISERLVLLEILPKEGSLLTLRIIRELQNELSFSEEELKEFNVRIEVHEGKIMARWDPGKENIEKDVPIGERATEIIVRRLKEFDEQKALTMRMMSVYEKFVEKP